MDDAQAIFEALIKRRGIKNLDDFINPNYESGLHSPLLLPDMPKAVTRLVEAQKAGETVAIYGDYDIDGLTATSLLLEAFARFGIKAISYIPDRYVDGYGLSPRGIKQLKSEGASVIVTVDCGSRSVDEVTLANSLGIDVIITDHHELGEELPAAKAVVNAKREDSQYPFRDLAGVGVAFKLVCGLQTQLDGLSPGQEKWLLDLVAFGTVCDVVDLVDENRVLVSLGLKVLKKTRRPGFVALAHVSAVSLDEADTSTFGYRFGPRLNAAGRLETAKAGLEILTTKKGQRAFELAQELDAMNHERRKQQQEIVEAAIEQAAKYADDPVLVLSSKDWSHGIVGIAAARLVETTGKPSFVLQELEDTVKGSARSYGDFHLADALKANEKLIVTGGGHAFAAGVTLPPEGVSKFRDAMNAHYKSLNLKNQGSFLKIVPDLELESFKGLNEELLELLSGLEPFGHANLPPVFLITNLELASWRAVGADAKHAKLTLKDQAGQAQDGIGFNLSAKVVKISSACTVLAYLEWNEWNGSRKPQLRIADIIEAE